VLFIGLGAGALPRMIRDRVETGIAERTEEGEEPPAPVRYTAVESSPEVAAVAEAFFGLNTEEIGVVVEDGVTFLKRAVEEGRKFDMIVLDAYAEGFMPPPHFMVEDFFALAKAVSGRERVHWMMMMMMMMMMLMLHTEGGA
jgi:spermidine synthase